MRLLPKMVLAALFACGFWWFLANRPIHHPAGVLVAAEPVQKNIDEQPLGVMTDWRLTAVAEYSLRGLVLGTKRYYSGPQADLVPVDVAVGWGKMSDQAVIDRLTISMTNRFYFYEWERQPPIPQDEIKVSSANNHVIAANDEVRKTIRGLRTGQIVALKGYLVNASGPGGRMWNSSLTRSDTGNGACELFYFESAKAVDSLAGEL